MGSIQSAATLRPYPLERFLPPYSPEQASHWVSQFTPSGSWILDPFGQDPLSILELARSGYRVLVTANNPVAAFILEVLASAPQSEEFAEAVKILSDLKNTNGLRFEDQISAFYRCFCPSEACETKRINGKTIIPSFEVESFIWNENEENPRIAIGTCNHCGFSGEITLTPEILQSFEKLPSYNLHRAQALELIASLEDPLREVMEEILHFYSPRALILLQILLNRIQSHSFTYKQKKLLQALFLTTADQVNQLWAYPLGRNRPKQLLRPPVFQEFNLWHVFKKSIKLWVHNDPPVIVKQWPDLPPQVGGISLAKCRLRELQPRLDPNLIKAVFSSLPRRNQAWWNLSALWCGWIWGREGVKTLRNSLLKQRYDWTWHATALAKVLGQLQFLVNVQTPVLLQIHELDPMFLLAGSVGAQEAKLNLLSAAIEGDNSALQTVWNLGKSTELTTASIYLGQAAKETAKDYLAHRGEPASFLRLFSVMVLNLQANGFLIGQPKVQPNGTLNELLEDIQEALKDSSNFSRFLAGISLETGLYWLTEPDQVKEPSADQVERTVLKELHMHQHLDEFTILERVNNTLRGFLTPSRELVQSTLQSYAERKEDGSKIIWELRPNEEPKLREQNLQEMYQLIEQMAGKLAYTCHIFADHFDWSDENGQKHYSFFPVTTAQIGQILLTYRESPGKKIFIIPGSRSNLITYKLKRDPNLQSIVEENWHFVKYRQIRNLNANPLLNRDLFATQIFSDPPEYHSSQLALF